MDVSTDPTMRSLAAIVRMPLVALLLLAGQSILRADSPAADADLARYAASLGSDSFVVRQEATQALIAAGPQAIPHVVQKIKAGDGEMRARGFAILREQALAPVASHRKGVRAALTELAHSSRPQIGSAAVRLQEMTAVAYAAKLQEYGAVVAPQASDRPARFSVQIGQKWSGGDHDLTLLTDLGRVNWLSLENASVTDAGLVHIGQLTDLERLYLGSSQVRGSGLKELAPLAGLRYLSLKQLPIGDRHLAELPSFPELQDLGLDWTQVGDEGLEHLARYPHLNRLWLDSTNVTDAGLVHLKDLAELRTLFLAGTRVRGPGLSELRELSGLTYLSLKQTNFRADGLEYVGQLKQIERLGLDNTNVNDDQLAALAGLSRLRELWLNSSQITDAGLVHLRGLKDLQVIHLDSTEVTSEGILELQRAIPLLHVTR